MKPAGWWDASSRLLGCPGGEEAWGLARHGTWGGFEQAATLVGWDGSPEGEALCVVAAQLAQRALNARGLDSFGSDAQAEVAAELDDRSDEHCIVMVGLHAPHERAIDLDLIDWQLLQLRQRGEAGAEVVNRDRHAHRAQLV